MFHTLVVVPLLFVSLLLSGPLPSPVMRSAVAAQLAAQASSVSELDRQWMRAISNDKVDVLRELLQTPSDKPSIDKQRQITVRAETGKNALMIACKTGDLDFVIELLSLGADPNSTTLTGGTPLMFSVLGNHRAVTEHMIGLKADVNAQGSNGWSAMTIAAAKGYADMAAYLIGVGADINALDVYRWTPLMRAVDNGQMDVVRLLISLPEISLDNQDEGGNTALHHAVAGEDVVLVRLLLERGVATDVSNFQQMTARQFAATLPSAARLLPLFPSD